MWANEGGFHIVRSRRVFFSGVTRRIFGRFVLSLSNLTVSGRRSKLVPILYQVRDSRLLQWIGFRFQRLRGVGSVFVLFLSLSVLAVLSSCSVFVWGNVSVVEERAFNRYSISSADPFRDCRVDAQLGNGASVAYRDTGVDTLTTGRPCLCCQRVALRRFRFVSRGHLKLRFRFFALTDRLVHPLAVRLTDQGRE